MHGFTVSLIVGFLLAYSSVWLVSRINDRYTQWEKDLCRVLVKRGKRDSGRHSGSNRGIAVLDDLKAWINASPARHFAPQSFLQWSKALPSFFPDHPPIGLFRSFYLACVRFRGLPSLNIRKEDCPMTVYEFYWKDHEGKEHFLGILPERRKNPQRITEESIKKWGKLVIGDWAMMNNFYFTQVNI